MNQDLKQRTSAGADDVVDVSGDEQQDNEENCAGECADSDTDDHDFGSLGGSMGDLWVHMVRMSDGYGCAAG